MILVKVGKYLINPDKITYAYQYTNMSGDTQEERMQVSMIDGGMSVSRKEWDEARMDRFIERAG